MEKLDGKLLSKDILNNIKYLADGYKKTPILAIISASDDELTKIIINNKKKACEEVGISLIHFNFDSSDSESKIIKSIKSLNKDKNINGISIELPLIDKFNTNKIINSIDPTKDVDGISDISQGKLINGNPLFISPSLMGVISLLSYYDITLESKNVLIIGNDNIICKPFMIECIKRNANVSICSSNSKDLKNYLKNADVILSHSNTKYLINDSMIKEGCVIIDMGSVKEDEKYYGDVNPNVKSKASFLAPRVGGVGPMSISMLLKNTMISYLNMNGEDIKLVKIVDGWSDING